MYAVSHRSKLHNERRACKRNNRYPVILETLLNIDMAYLSKSERYSRQDKHYGCSYDRYSEAANERPPHELRAKDHFPANLKVKSNGADKTEYNDYPPAKKEHCTCKRAGEVGIHILGSDLIVTLVRLRTEGDYECDLHAANSKGKANAQVVTMGSLCRQYRIGNEQEHAKR